MDSAVKIVLAGNVELQAEGTAKVASQSNGSAAYQVVNGHCDCKDFASVEAQVEQASQWLSVQAPAQPPTQGKTQHAHEDSPYCRAHKAVLKRYERNAQVWYSHKTADGRWCRGQ